VSRKPKWAVWVASIAVSIPLLVIAWAAFIAGTRLHGSQPQDGLAPMAFTAWGFFLIFAVAVPVGMLAEDDAERRENEDCQKDCNSLEDALKTIADPTLRGLAQSNFKQMRRFTVIAQRQARTSYYASLIAAAVTLAVLVSGAVTAVGLSDTSARAWSALLTAIGALLTGFLTHTFVKTYDMAARQMSYYYGQPLVHCYLLHAEWLLSGARDQYGDDKAFVLLHEVVSASIQAGTYAQRRLMTLDEIRPTRGRQRTSAKVGSPQVPEPQPSSRTHDGAQDPGSSSRDFAAGIEPPDGQTLSMCDGVRGWQKSEKTSTE
jgi:hypothetical protein